MIKHGPDEKGTLYHQINLPLERALTRYMYSWIADIGLINYNGLLPPSDRVLKPSHITYDSKVLRFFVEATLRDAFRKKNIVEIRAEQSSALIDDVAPLIPKPRKKSGFMGALRRVKRDFMM